MGRVSYTEVVWKGKTIRRRVLSKAANAERIRKIRAARLAQGRKAKAAKPAKVKVRRNAEPQAKPNGAPPPRVELVHEGLDLMKQGKDWLERTLGPSWEYRIDQGTRLLVMGYFMFAGLGVENFKSE